MSGTYSVYVVVAAGSSVQRRIAMLHAGLCLCKLKFSVDFLLMKYYDDMSIQSIEFQ